MASVTIASKEELNVFVKKLEKSDCVTLFSIYSEKSNIIPKMGGLYIFWWTGHKEQFLKNIKTHKHLIKGRQTQEEMVNVKFSDDWINIATIDNKICLYVGKTTNLQQRITSHVKPQTENIWGDTEFDSGRKPNTVSQMRIGIEKIFKNKKGLDTILKNVSVSYIDLDGINNCVNRFYLEDFCVGTYFPLLNIDIER